jgi:hypothetical protein
VKKIRPQRINIFHDQSSDMEAELKRQLPPLKALENGYQAAERSAAAFTRS